MSSPYTSQAISGYNANPPSDDAAETSANTVKWATHKGKLADPIKTLSEAVNTELVAAFGKIFGADFDTKSDDYAVLAADQGQFLVMDTAAKTFTLPAVGSVNANFALAFLNTSTGVVTIDGNSSETINGATTITLLAGDFIIVTSDGATWIAIGDINNSSGTFVPTFTGFSADPGSPNIDWQVRNGVVTVQMRFTTGTSDATGFGISNWPAAIQPSVALEFLLGGLQDNGANLTGPGALAINGANATFYSDAAQAGWTDGSTKGLTAGAGTVVMYPKTVP